ncbi:MAG: IPTL-CTERM sorting domain-containing protein [Thermoanaerobaculia bacterium]|jgi:uncharacterized repeat protein (TIGR01451 family)
MRFVPKFVVVLAVGSLALASCTQVSVTGPCVVQSNSSITLDVEWMVGTSGIGAKSSLAAGGTVQKIAAAVQQRRTGNARPESVQVQAENDSMLIMLEVPDNWTAGVSSGDINGTSATVLVSDAAPFCSDSFGTVRVGYARKYFKISNGVALVDGDGGTLQVTFATATVAEGVYHPAVFVAPETADGTGCVPSTAFHRVVAGAPVFVNFDVSSHFNSDLVVNEGDTTQDTLLTISSASSTAHLAFATASFFGDDAGMPDDGLITSSTLETQLSALGFPLLVDRPECLPSIQLGFSNASNGNNAWLQQTVDEELTFAVPPARYAEVILLVTPGAGDLGGSFTEEALLRGMAITLTYDDASTSQVETLLPILGLPFGFGALPGLIPGSTDVVPSVSMAFGLLVPTDGSEAVPDGEGAAAGITALMVTPDPTRTLVSVTILPLAPSLNPTIAARTNGIRPAAVDPVSVAFFGAAGMQFVDGAPDLAVAKSVLTAGPYIVGSNVTYRITVTNGGGADSTAVTVTDTLPAQLSWVSSTASAGSCSQAAGTVTCNMGVLAAGASETVDIVATIVGSGNVANTAEASMVGGEANTGDNSATANFVAAAAVVTSVPTLSEWSLILLMIVLGGAALLRIRS